MAMMKCSKAATIGVMKKLAGLMIVVACAVTLFGGALAYAAQTDERIKSFDSQIIISPDNVAHIKETIVYDFGTTSHHGIYRDIPIDYKDGDKNYYLSARYADATDENGNKVNAEISEVSGNERLKLGDADTTITGVHTYVINYTLSPIVTEKDGKPFLNLDVLGAGWQVPVDRFTASVNLSGGALSNIAWYDAPGHESSTIRENIPAYTGVTINASLPQGYVTNYLVANKPRPFDFWQFMREFGVVLLAALIIGVAVLVVVLRKWRAHARRRSQTVIPEYEPPADMTPAEIGLLQDDSANMREVTATVIDWAVRGYLKVTRVDKKGWFGSAQYILTRLKSDDGLSEPERHLFAAFFSKGDEVNLKDLDKSKTALAVGTFKAAIKRILTDAGYYAKSGGILNRGNLTEHGAKQWAKVDGFKLYLGVVEKDRLEFTDAPEKTPERFNALLPYAIALGVEKQWAKQFEGVDVASATTWYNGNLAAFSAISLVDDLGSSFASTVSSNATVSSSGGVSGGGFGGGGGGSW
jgi:hypothetical protein